MKPLRQAALAGIRFLALLAALLPGYAPAIPIEVHDPEVSLTVPSGFEEMAPLTNAPEVVRLFVRRPGPEEAPDTWLTIRKSGSDWTPPADGSAVLGRYAERLNNLDVEVLQSRVSSNAETLRESQAQMPVGTALLQINLKSRAMEDHEMKDLMRQVLTSASTQPPEQRERFQGWGAVGLCLLLGAVLIVIAFGRR